jgi:flagellar biosynthesis protein FlhF
MDSNTSSFDNILLKKISCHIPVTGPISVNPEKRKIVALIGPTGVGKTTTLAKIAARCSIIQGIKTKILTMDTYRIAAAEQLKIYGKIMGIPVNVVLNHSELEKEIRSKDNVNLILIDTAGRNYRDNEQINEINLWIQKYEEIEPYLLLSSTTSEDVLMATLKCFGKCRVASIVITKIDETLSFGHLFNALISFKKPVSYITTGQRVPEDIEPASAGSLSEIFLNGFNN